jgi:hypothetical protein
MTDERPGIPEPSQPTPPPGMNPVERDDAKVLEGAGDFTSGEGLVAFAGMLLIADWLLFGVLANDYWVGWVALVPAIAVILLPRMDREKVERFHPLPDVMKVLGYTIVIVGALTIVEDIRFAGGVFDEIFGVIGALVAYAAFVMAFLGARQIKT